MTECTMIVPAANQEIIEASGANALLERVRPQWKAKRLIQRVARILPVDPSSACQRIFNAAVYDLKEKIVVAGLDIAGEASRQYNLPNIQRAEDVENLSVSRTIELAYRMGLLSRPEWRRLLRVYDIRKDLEHEDDEYEAGVEDCVYIFKTCVEVVLARDPIHVIKLTDIKEIVEQPSPSTLGQAVIGDCTSAPQPRQLEIYRFLISSTLNPDHPDIVRQNWFNALGTLRSATANQVIIDAAGEFQNRIGRRCPNLAEARVAAISGVLPYLKQAHLRDFFSAFADRMKTVGYAFRSNEKHGELLRNLQELGGLDYCPKAEMKQIVKWLVLCFLGEPSFGRYSSSRRVFFSNIGAPIAFSILSSSQRDVGPVVNELRSNDRDVRSACGRSEHIERRFQEILDCVEK
jgi:hypothetical protein